MRRAIVPEAPSTRASVGRHARSICRVARPGLISASALSSGDKPKQTAPVKEVTGDVLDLKSQSASAALSVPNAKTAAIQNGYKADHVRCDLPSPEVAVRNLLEHSRFGHLCSVMSNMHHRRAGYPFGTLVDFATDAAGHPIFSLSPLAIHPRNLKEDSRTSLVVQMPGWTGLGNARVTMFGDVHPLPEDLQSAARDLYFAKHANERKERFISGNAVYYRMNKIVDIYFVGGFGTVQWIDPKDYSSCQPDEIVMEHPMRTLRVLNEHYSQYLPKLVHTIIPPDEMQFISIDAHGCDIRVRHGSEFSMERLGFPVKVHNKREAMDAVEACLKLAKH